MAQVRWKENQLATYVYFHALYGVPRVREQKKQNRKMENHFKGKGRALYHLLPFLRNRVTLYGWAGSSVFLPNILSQNFKTFDYEDAPQALIHTIIKHTMIEIESNKIKVRSLQLQRWVMNIVYLIGCVPALKVVWQSALLLFKVSNNDSTTNIQRA